MSPTITLAAIMLVPIVVLTVLRVNAALVFLSLCLGNVLVQFVAPDASSLLRLFATSSAYSLQLLLLVLPVVLTTILMVRTVKGKLRLLLNLLPASGVGLLGSLLAVPLLSPGLHYAITASTLWQQMQRAQDLIVGLSALVCLLVLWLLRSKSGGEAKHPKHSKA